MGREVLEKIKDLSLSKIKENLAAGQYGSSSDPDTKLVENYIREKELENDRELAKNGLEIARLNTKSTEGLVKATWGLVIVTAILALITYFKR